MRQRQHKFVTLISVMTMLCSLCRGCPNEAGPTCTEELPNAVLIINRLKKSLKDLYLSLGDEGYGDREFRGPVCILRNNGIRAQPMDLDTIDTRLCQYAKCFQHFAGIVGLIGDRMRPNIRRKIEYCQKYLNQLENTVKKMKRQPSALCPAPCRISWTFTDQWDEITKGMRLAQELLIYLEQLKLSCS